MATTFASQSASPPAPAARAAIAVVAEPFAARRIGAALESGGLSAVLVTETVDELLEDGGGRHPDAVVLACDPFEAQSIAAIRRIADTLRPPPLVVVSSASDGVGVRQAVNAGADGVVYETELENPLGPITQAVLVGHVSLPRRFH